MEPSVVQRQDSIQTRVVVVAEVRLYREGLSHVLERDMTLRVMGTSATATEAVKLAVQTSADVVLLDVGMPGSEDIICALRSQVPEAKIVGLGVAERAEDVLACVEAGINGYVPREGTIQDLLAVTANVMEGGMLCSPKMVAALAGRVQSLAHPGHRLGTVNLTVREEEVAALLVGGLSNKEIAVRLHIEVPTVKNHIHKILEKLHAQSRTQVAVRLKRVTPWSRRMNAGDSGL